MYMNKYLKYASFGVAAVLILAGAGCQKNSGSSATNDNKNNNNGASVNTGNTVTSKTVNGGVDYEKNFEDTVEVDLPESPALGTEGQIRPLLKKVFGQLKVSSYGADFMGTGSLSVVYIMSRAWANNDINTMSKVLKDNGYNTSMMNSSNGVSSGLFQGKDYDLYLGGQGQEVSVTFSPHYQ